MTLTWLPSRLRSALAERPLMRRVASNVGWLVFERLAPMLTGFVVNAMVVRYLGPTQYGLFSYAFSFAVLFGSLASLGTEAVIVRELARSPEAEAEILGTGLVLRLAAAAVVWLGAVGAAIRLHQDGLTRVLIAVMSAEALSTALAVFECWFRARIAARGMVVARTASVLVNQVGRVCLVLMGASLPAFATLTAATGVLGAAAVYLLYARSSKARLRYSGARARQLLRDSWPLVIVNISAMVYMKIDQVMLTDMAGARENGIYATAVTLSEIWFFLPMAIGRTVFPLIVQSHEQEQPERFEAKLQVFYDAMTGLGYAVAVPVLLLAGPVVRLVFGGAYAQSAAVLQVHVVSFVFICMGIARSLYLVTKNYVRFNMASSVAAAALNVVLNLVLIPPYGAMGAAWSTVISYAAANYFSGLLTPGLWRQTWMLTRSLAVPVRLPQVIRSFVSIRE